MLIREKNLPWREIDGRAVIIQSGLGRVHELNPVATFLWSQVDGVRSVEDIALELVENFEVSPEEALQDTNEFFASLSELGLVSCPS